MNDSTRNNLLSGALILLLAAEPAHAYIDPGSGSFLLQMVLAAVVGAMFHARQAIARIRGFFRRLAGKKDE